MLCISIFLLLGTTSPLHIGYRNIKGGRKIEAANRVFHTFLKKTFVKLPGFIGSSYSEAEQLDKLNFILLNLIRH